MEPTINMDAARWWRYRARQLMAQACAVLVDARRYRRMGPAWSDEVRIVVRRAMVLRRDASHCRATSRAYATGCAFPADPAKEAA